VTYETQRIQPKTFVDPTINETHCVMYMHVMRLRQPTPSQITLHPTPSSLFTLSPTPSAFDHTTFSPTPVTFTAVPSLSPTVSSEVISLTYYLSLNPALSSHAHDIFCCVSGGEYDIC
jgi:hypothetical protein